MESGHRCAIHTCRFPDVDLHHIIPWARCREHTLDNLIALCPNCHRRVHGGEIDAKSLRLYKARLRASLTKPGDYPAELSGSEQFSWIDPLARWDSRKFEECVESLELTISLEYPNFVETSPELAAVNFSIDAIVNNHFRSFRAMIASFISTESLASPPFFSSSFSVPSLTDKLCSVELSIGTYSGGAHGSHFVEGHTYLLDNFRKIEICDVFDNVSQGLAAISEFCIKKLIDEFPELYASDDSWLTDGASPSECNYQNFVIKDDFLTVIFGEYQVGPYAIGIQTVDVPWTSIVSVLSPDMRQAIERFS